jgi:hypothetical protein
MASPSRRGAGSGPDGVPGARTTSGDPLAGPCRRCMISRKRSFTDQVAEGTHNFPAVLSRRHRIPLTARSLLDSRPFRFLCPLIVSSSGMGRKGFVLPFVRRDAAEILSLLKGSHP